jgi:hypothetical protein
VSDGIKQMAPGCFHMRGLMHSRRNVGLVIPCRVASPQHPAPFHQAASNKSRQNYAPSRHRTPESCLRKSSYVKHNKPLIHQDGVEKNQNGSYQGVAWIFSSVRRDKFFAPKRVHSGLRNKAFSAIEARQTTHTIPRRTQKILDTDRSSRAARTAPVERPSPLKGDEPAPQGVANEVRLVFQAELPHQARAVVFDRPLTDVESR